MNTLTRLWKEEEGQALSEYGLILGLVAIAVVTILTTLGTSLQGVFQSIIDELPGGDGQ